MMAIALTNPRDLENEFKVMRCELDEARAVLAAIGNGEADALIVKTASGPKVYTLKSADQPYRTLVETLNEGAVTTTTDGVVLYCNDAFARLLGRENSSLLGNSLADLIGSDVVGALTAGGGARGFECSLPHGDRTRRDCIISSVPHQADGETIWCLLVTDVTGQALRLQHTAIVESTSDAILSFDCAGRITSWNQAAEKLFGYSVKEAIGKDASLLVAPLGKPPPGETERGAFDAALAGERFQRDTQRVAKDGTVIDVGVTATQIRAPNGQIIGVSAIMRDISARKQAEAALREREAELSRAHLIAGLGSFKVEVRDGNFLADRSPEYFAVHGLPPQDRNNSHEAWLQRLHPEDREGADRTFREFIADGRNLYQSEYRILRENDGATRWIKVLAEIERDAAGAPLRFFGTHLDVTESRLHEAALRESEIRYRRLFEASQDGVLLLDPGTLRIVDANPFMTTLLGYPRDQLIGMELHEIGFLADEQASSDMFKTLRAERQVRYDDLRLQCRAGTAREVEVVANLYDEDGHFVIQCNVRDITERKRAAERVQLLMQEINHRANNMLGLVLAIARKTAATRPEDFIERFDQRVQALAANQELLIKSEWKAVPLVDLVRSQLAHFGDGRDARISLAGPPVEITAAASQSLGMALHELATNAAKYGALSNEVGRVAIRWDVCSDASGKTRFAMSWLESDGPPVEMPSRRGFGSTVIGGMIKMSLSCDPEIDFAPAGLAWRFDCPAESVIVGGSGRPMTRSHDAAAASPALTAGRRRVLVVEDEPIIAMEIVDALSGAGWEVVGPASTVAQALALIAETGCDAAVLDTNLGGETSEPVARELILLGTPFVVASGYSREQQPPVMREAPLIGKPLRIELLVAVISRCLG